MTTTNIDVPTLEQKEEHRKELAKQVEEYLAKGGKITNCPRNAYTETEVKNNVRRKHGVSFASDSLTDPTKRMLGGFVQHKKKEN